MTKDLYFGIISSLIVSLFLTVSAVASDEEISKAPLNPEFQEYLQSLPSEEAVSTPLYGVDETGEKKYALGGKPSPVNFSHLTGKAILGSEKATFPSRYDLRTTGKLTPIKDQGHCGSCWAFASMAPLESFLLPAENADFSENNLNNTSGFDYGPCNGGTGDMATAYFARWSGPVNEVDDPYNVNVDTNSPDPAKRIFPSPTGLTVRKHLQDMLVIPPRASSTDNNNIKAAIMSYGAAEVYIYWQDQPGMSYFNNVHNSYYYNGTRTSNHAVAIVGWDDNFDRSKFAVQPPGNGAFIVRNSWGTSFGENGYFYISYYDTKIGRTVSGFRSLYFNFQFEGEQPTNYSRIYQYDPLGQTSHIGYNSNTAWLANIFTASTSESLAAVSFYTPAVNSTYEIKVFTNATSGPISGTLASSKTGMIEAPGYHTIPLTTPAPLTAGQKFSVTIKLTTPGYNFPVPIESPIPNYTSHATAQSGQSFTSSNGTTWSDLTVAFPKSNVCLKAFTTTAASCSFTLSSSSHTFTSLAGSDSVQITASSATCPWTANSTASWITISSNTEGSGSGAVNYSVTANATPVARTATMFIAGETFTVTQAGNASSVTNMLRNPGFESGNQDWTSHDTLGYDIIWQDRAAAHRGEWIAWMGGADAIVDDLSQDISIPANAGQPYLRFWYLISTDEASTSASYDILSVRILDRATDSTLATLTSLSNLNDTKGGWIQSPIFDLSAYNGRSIRLLFHSSTDSTNATSFLIDDVEVASAVGVTCTFSFTPTSGNFSSVGGTAQIAITASSSTCSWSASSAASWVTLTGSGSGSGNGSVNFTVSANTTGQPRTATLTVAGINYTVNQAAGSAQNANLVSNGDFESGEAAWSNNGGVITNNSALAHAGNFFAWLGGYNDAHDYLYQEVDIPANASTVSLQFWYLIATAETSTSTRDNFKINITRPDGSLLSNLGTLGNLQSTSASWRQSANYDLSSYKGQRIRLAFVADTDSTNVTSFAVDDIQLLTATAPAPTLPGAPTVTTVVPANGSATVSFTAPPDGGSPITSYRVSSNPDSKTATGPNSPIVVTGLTNGKAYSFTVTASNAVGAGAVSAPSTPVVPATVPDAPTSVSAGARDGSATVTFVAPASDGGSAITGYTVTSSPAGGVDSNAGSTLTSHLLTGLTNGTSYTFTVRASNAFGAGQESASSNTITPGHTAAPTLNLGSASGSKGSTVSVPISLTNVAGTDIYGMAMDIGYDTSILSSPTISIGLPPAVGPFMGVNKTEIAPGRLQVGVIINTGAPGFDANQLVPLGNGVIAQLSFTVSANAPQGTTTLTAKSSATDKLGAKITTTSTNGSVNVGTKAGDCDGLDGVTIDEVQSAIAMFLRWKPPTSCVDLDGQDGVTIDEVQKVIAGFLRWI